MDDLNKPEDSMEEVDELIEEEELGLSDKIVSVLSEPGELFTKLAKFPVKTMDWLLPILFVVIVVIGSIYNINNNPELKAAAIEKQMEQFEKNFQEAVDKGQMTQEQADSQLDMIAERMEEAGGGQFLIQAVATFIIFFITFFIIAGVFLLLAKFALGGIGDYKASMLAYGLPHYIIVIQVIIMIIAAIAMGQVFMDASLGSFMGIEKEGLYGWFMHKLDPLSIWFYTVVGIGYAKMFKSDNTMKYIIAILAMWIGFSLLFYFLAEAIPFLKWFGM